MAPMSGKIAANRVNNIGRLDLIFNICWERIKKKGYFHRPLFEKYGVKSVTVRRSLRFPVHAIAILSIFQKTIAHSLWSKAVSSSQDILLDLVSLIETAPKLGCRIVVRANATGRSSNTSKRSRWT
jgi:hypothetical protein